MIVACFGILCNWAIAFSDAIFVILSESFKRCEVKKVFILLCSILNPLFWLMCLWSPLFIESFGSEFLPIFARLSIAMPLRTEMPRNGILRGSNTSKNPTLKKNLKSSMVWLVPDLLGLSLGKTDLSTTLCLFGWVTAKILSKSNKLMPIVRRT